MNRNQKKYSAFSTSCLLLLILTLIPALPAFSEEGDDTSSSGMSARERFMKKYKDKIPTPPADIESEIKNKVEPPRSQPDRAKRLEEMNKKRMERRKAHAQQREDRRKKLQTGKEKMEGKAADVSKKEKERLDARRKAMQEKKAASQAEQRAKIEKRRQAMKEKILKHREEMKNKVNLERGAAGYNDADSKLEGGNEGGGSPARMDRMQELKKRREAMREKARQYREAMRSRQRGTAGMEQRQDSSPHISGSTTQQDPDPHISGSTSGPADRPHISGGP